MKKIKPNFKKLNLGCGWRKIPGFLNIDISPEVKPDMVVDLSEGLPFLDNTFEEIYSSHVIEHIIPCKFRFVLEEIGRVAKNGCILELYLPLDNIFARTTIDHYRTFSYTSFDEFCEKFSHHKHYFSYRLERLIPKPNFLKRVWYQFFPFTKGTVHFRFRIIKDDQDRSPPPESQAYNWKFWETAR